MSDLEGERQLYIGWDVGGWNCEKNRESRDALVAIDHASQQIGSPWRGNLRKTINQADSTLDFLLKIQDLCCIERTSIIKRVTLAIDAPLAFPEALVKLAQGITYSGSLEKSADNPYLYRLTERRLVAEGVYPLSSIKDMIGSQSSKAMHAVSRFCPQRVGVGVWSDMHYLTAIETYPALYRFRASNKEGVVAKNGREADIADARICASVARLFAMERYKLEAPPPEVPESEGWIWAPLRSEQQVVA